MYLSKPEIVFGAALVAAFVCVARPAMADVPDQAAECDYGAVNIYQQTAGQSFKPAQSSVVAAAVRIQRFNSSSGTVSLTIRSGDHNGAVLGSKALNLNLGFTPTWVRFDFDSPIAVTPEGTYFLQILALNDAFGFGYSNECYDRGAGFMTPSSLPGAEFNFRTYGPCGNGTIDAGEDCDDGILAPDGCCDESCQFVDNGVECTLADSECTTETCNGSGTCVATGNVAEGTVCTPDDTDLCTQEQCDGAGACVGEFEPRTTCATAEKATLGITDSSKPGKDSVKFAWKKGTVEASHVAGLTTTSTDAFTVCVYDDAGRVSSASLPVGTAWTVTTKGTQTQIKYDDKDGSVSGITSAAIKAIAGEPESQVSLKQKGDLSVNLSSPLTGTVHAQAVTTSGGCWGADFTGEAIKKNEDGKFKGVAK